MIKVARSAAPECPMCTAKWDDSTLRPVADVRAALEAWTGDGQITDKENAVSGSEIKDLERGGHNGTELNGAQPRATAAGMAM